MASMKMTKSRKPIEQKKSAPKTAGVATTPKRAGVGAKSAPKRGVATTPGFKGGSGGKRDKMKIQKF